jgi:hypothetical protein
MRGLVPHDRVCEMLSRATLEKPPRLLPLKTEAGVRDVVLAPELGKLLKAHKLASGYSNPEQFVFTSIPIFLTARGITPTFGRRWASPTSAGCSRAAQAENPTKTRPHSKGAP